MKIFTKVKETDAQVLSACLFVYITDRAPVKPM